MREGKTVAIPTCAGVSPTEDLVAELDCATFVFDVDRDCAARSAHPHHDLTGSMNACVVEKHVEYLPDGLLHRHHCGIGIRDVDSQRAPFCGEHRMPPLPHSLNLRRNVGGSARRPPGGGEEVVDRSRQGIDALERCCHDIRCDVLCA